MKTPAIMFQGTGSGVGKSILAAGFCRLLARKGIKAAPFKAQNMALNSGVVNESLEMGRAQILQAEAALVTPDVRMNPILLKPQGNSTSQLVRMGKVVGNVSARDYYTLSQENFEIVKNAYDSLASEYDVIVLEGAGSPAEINLQATDIVNMRMAEYAEADVYIVGDIDRGGVFAWMKGTADLVRDEHKNLIKGYIINKFRGDISLLQPGVEMFEEYVDAPVCGTLPYVRLTLEEEDSQDISSDIKGEAELKVGVVRLPKISNFSDFAPLKSHSQISVSYIDSPSEVDNQDIIIIPGSKNTIADMQSLVKSGLADKLSKVVGIKPIMGICGGYQMLGRSIRDPHHIEGDEGECAGLGLLDMETVIEKDKKLHSTRAVGLAELDGLNITGYEMHMGVSQMEESAVQLSAENNQIVYDKNRKILGTYLHGIFENGKVMSSLISLLCGIEIQADEYSEKKDAELNMLADLIEECCDTDYMLGRIEK